MNLAQDLKILREIRVDYKHRIIMFVAHLYTDHAEAMEGIDGEALKYLVYSSISTESLAKELETS